MVEYQAGMVPLVLEQTSSHLAENIKRLRGRRQLTQQELAKLSGVPRPTIANLESGGANPTLSVLVRIAGSLQASIEELIGTPRAAVSLHRAGSLPARQRGGAVIKKLLPDAIPGMEIDRIELTGGARVSEAPHTPGTREYLVCEAGEIELTVSQETIRILGGDVVCFRGDQKHAYLNRGRRSAVAYSIVVLAPIGS